jgi:hypothetical protein
LRLGLAVNRKAGQVYGLFREGAKGASEFWLIFKRRLPVQTNRVKFANHPCNSTINYSFNLIMKIIIHLLPLLLLPLLSIGQNSFDYTISKPYPVIDGQTNLYFSDISTEKALSIKIDGKDVYLQNFDTKIMKETGRKKYSDLLQDNEFEHATNYSKLIFQIKV